MHLLHKVLVLLSLATVGAHAADPFWHRSVVLDYHVAADGSATATEIWQVRADTNATAQIIAQQSFNYVADLEDVEITAAYTQKRDGRILPVPASSIMDKAVTTVAAAPQFSALTARTLIFPQVAAGDTVRYELRRATRHPLFPGQFLLSVEPGGGGTASAADIRITLAPGRSLRVATSGLQEASPEIRADGSTLRTWHLAPDASGAVSLDASTFADYAAVGRAYAARAWPASAPGEQVRALADRLVPPGTGQRQAALLLYRYVATEIRYVATFLGDGRVVPRDAQTVLAEGWGDCKDHAALLQALLAAKGIEAQPALISMQDRYDLPPAPGLSALDHVITYLPALDLYLDSTASYAPFGVLPAGEYDKPVVLADPASARVARTPPMPQDGIVLATRTQAKMGAEGEVEGRTTTIADGSQGIALRSLAAWVEGRGVAYAASAQLQQLGTPGNGHYDFDSPGNAGGPYQVEGWFSLDDKLPDGPAAPFPIPRGLTPFGRPGRLLLNAGLTDDGVHTCFPGHQTEQIELELPRGMHPAAIPPDVEVGAGGAAYTAQYKLVDGVLTVVREFRLATDHQRCRPAEFDVMQIVLDAARRDGLARLSLVPDAPQQIAGVSRPTL